MKGNGGATTLEVELGERLAWHALEVSEVESRLGTSRQGLSSAEAEARLLRYGPNRLEEAPPPSSLAILLHQFQSPLIYILVVAAGVALFLGDYIDAGVIAAVLVIDAAIGFVQERQAEVSVRALMRLVAPKARVIRDGREREVESRELVPGDLVVLESGSRVPADLRLIEATALAIDESLLTGESVPVGKRTEPRPAATPLADRTNLAYAGTIVTRGRARGYVVATGTATELGRIAERVRTTVEPETPLQQRMSRFARVIGLAVVASAVTAFAVGVVIGESPTEMFMVAVALAVSAIPEGLPVAFTIVMAIGVRRMARRNAIVRRLPAVETLGSTTTIGSDKTGTLTENRMMVLEIWAGGRTYRLRDGADPEPGAEAGVAAAELAGDSPLSLTLLTGVLTNEAEVYRTPEGFESRGDPTEAALLIAAARLGLEPEEVRAAFPLRGELPFEPERQYSASIRGRDGELLLFVKGAPERVAAMCTELLTEEGPAGLDREVVLQAARDLAGRGLRVLGMAYGVVPDPGRGLELLAEPRGLTFVGLQGMLDPPREGVREAIAGCRRAGIRVLMITGDHAVTARSIGQELGMVSGDAPVLTGSDLEALDDETLARRLREVAIYARVAPEQKLRIVNLLHRQGEVVAVTGDGVNDAPALKAADIGVAMGRSGTDVAREAADIVLADDNFVSIYAAVEQGRVTFDNLRKVTFFLVSTGVAEVLTILASLALGWPLPFLPAQILWLNLVTEGLQDVALAFEPGEPGVLERPPRPRGEGIVSRLLWERTLVAGLVMAAGTLWLFRWELDQSGLLSRAQTVALTTMVLFQTFQVGNARSETRSLFRMNPLSNPFLFVAATAALLVHVAALYLGPTQFVLRIEPIELEAWGRMALVASAVLVAVELHKAVRRGARPERAAERRPDEAAAR